jgi:hypothetical protein
VAVLGGGASGLTAAYLLKKQGYEDVTVFEKDSEVGGVARTEYVKGKPYDMATMFVPGGSIGGEGIEMLLEEMINLTGEKLIPATDFQTLDVSTGQLDSLFEVLQDGDEEAIKTQLLQGLAFSTQWAGCFGRGLTCVECGICSSNDEILLDWGDRVGVPFFAKLGPYGFDGLGAGPTAQALAGRALLSSFFAVEVAYMLRELGVTSSNVPEGTPPNVVSLLNSQRWWFFERGYQTFWQSLVEKAKIDVKTEQQITSLERDAEMGKWVVHTTDDNPVHHFDLVLITTPPANTVEFLFDGPQRELLLSTGTPPVNDAFIATVKNFEKCGLPEESAWWPSGFGQGSLDFVDPAFGGGPTKPVYWQKRHSGRDVIVVATYNFDIRTTPTEAFEVCKKFAQDVLGFEIEKEIHHERFPFPAYPLDPVSFAAGWSQLQGKDGLFVTGEAFSGSGVPAITQYSNFIIPLYFPMMV